MNFYSRPFPFPLPLLLLLLLLLWFAACSRSAPNLEPRQSPEAQLAERHMVSVACPHAAQAGLEILRAGGTAIDAAVAIQAMLTFSEPTESGIGGGAFLLFQSGETGEMLVFNGRETAPQAARPDRFLLLGQPLPLPLAVPTGAAFGVPGTLALLHEAHQQFGQLPWAALFQPAIDASRTGIPYPPALLQRVQADYSIQFFGDLRRHFVYQARGEAPQFRNEALAETLSRNAEEGPDVFYRGDLTGAMISTARARRPFRSDITAADFDAYQVLIQQPVCGSYRGYRLCGPPPPSSGGIAVLQILGMLEHFDFAALSPDDPAALHLIAEASRLAFADRFLYLGDPDFTDIPVQALLNPAYLCERAALIDPARAMSEAFAGDPLRLIPEQEGLPIPDEPESQGTTHFSVIDAYGNRVSMTSSIEAPFGNRMMTNGFLLNNQLTDFTFRPVFGGEPHPNAVAAGKRPRSSMSPFIVTDEAGELRLIVGSRGGSRIIGYVVQTLIGVLDWNLSIQQAAALPNMVHRGEYLELEAGTPYEALRPALEAMGHRVRISTMQSGVHGIEQILAPGSPGQRTHPRLRGGADPRLDGLATGD